MLRLLHSLLGETRGVSAVDYSLIAAIIAVAGISAMRAIGAKSVNTMNAIATTLT
ncbi:MAG TPA: Flp family type IVb pilin [Reyranellaceae bacterium]|nr:Flp family type IVb pilin [Reyranellaceae bacterium]